MTYTTSSLSSSGGNQNLSNAASTVANTIGGSYNFNGGFINSTPWSTSQLYDEIINGNGRDEFELLISALTESKVLEITEIAKMNLTETEFKRLIRKIVISRHLSEDFLLKYIDYISTEDLYTKHYSDIKSREYSALVLLLESREK